MKKLIILALAMVFSNLYSADVVVINNDLLEIKAMMPEAKKVGVIYNSSSFDLKGGAASVQAIAMGIKNGPELLTQSKVMLNNVDAIYLMKGRFVTAEKLARSLVASAEKTGVQIFTNDPALRDIPGIKMVGMLGSSTEGATAP